MSDPNQETIDEAIPIAGTPNRKKTNELIAAVISMITTLSGKVIGTGQTWKTVGRSKNTSYQNTSSKPIQQIIAHTNDSTGAVAVSENNSTWISIGQARIDGNGQTVCFIVPPGWYYKTEGTVNRWAELS